MRIAILVLAGAVLAACASPSVDLGKSGVTGTVVSGPHCPVERADSPCPDLLVPGVVVVALDADDHVVRSDTTDDDGRFGMPLPPGRYTVTVRGLGGIQSADRVVAVVRAGAVTTVSILVDTGIR